MNLYKCWNCGAVMEREEVVWRHEKFDEPAFNLYPFCCACGSDDVTAEHACDLCESQPADDFLGDMHVCAGCARHIRDSVEKHVEALAKEEALDYRSAKDWFLAWADSQP